MTTEIHLDSEPLATGTHKGVSGVMTIHDPGKDFKSCGVAIGQYAENETDGSHGLVTAVTENAVTVTLTGGTAKPELVTNGELWAGADDPTPLIPPTGWAIMSLASFHVYEGYILGISKSVLDRPGIVQTIAAVKGLHYTLETSLYITRVGGDGYARIVTNSSGLEILSADAVLTDYSRAFIATAASFPLHAQAYVTDASVCFFDRVSIKKTSNVFQYGDTYNIYKTATKNQEISRIYTERRFGRKIFSQGELNTHGHLHEDEDLDIDNPGRVFGPGQPSRRHR